MLNILLIDNHKMILESLTLLIESKNENNVIYKASSGKDGLNYLQTEREKVDLVVCDISMPDMNGLEVLKKIKKDLPTKKVILLTQFAGEHYITKSIELGANGYVLKSCEGSVLLQAIERVMLGDFFLCKRTNAVFVNSSRKKAVNQHLTDREKSIIILITKGKSNEDTAKTLNISKHTVVFHRKNIFNKLNLESLAELTVYALQSGLLIFQEDSGPEIEA